MYKHFSVVFCVMQVCSSATVAQLCKITAQFEEKTAKVILDWNMIGHTAKTTYVLLRSTDTKAWTEIVTEKILRNYTEEDLIEYDDKVSRDQKYFYRLKIIDANNKTIAISNIAAIGTEADKTPWVIYPNPVNDILSLVYQGDNVIKGVINVTVQDVTGKIVTRFRAASNNKKLEIPVSKYLKGMYVVQISIMNEMVMNQQFVKQ